jgi:hypothetical protein
MSKSKKVESKLSELAGVDKGLFRDRNPSQELRAMRKEWDKEFERRTEEF